MISRLESQYQQFRESLTATPLATWQDALPADIVGLLNPYRQGDLPAWLRTLDALPAEDTLGGRIARLDRAWVSVESETPLPGPVVDQIETGLRALSPWRKGPFRLFGVSVDSEWRSDFKWDRLAAYIDALDDRLVLDVGCGNGYHMWRALGAGAARVVGVDPTPLFLVQFSAIRHLAGAQPLQLLPCTLEALPRLAVFDTVFSMGVLYHRRDPIAHLTELRECLDRDGQLVLETLVIPGDEQSCLMPRDRYACMRNVWFIPSVPMLEIWLRRAGFADARCVDVTVTTSEEQRRTDWTGRHSLSDFLDPANPARTLEGYPAPRRAILLARRRF
ncbi:MAG: tRNA 5-methoxyuridine(34)/uridine 5-oxyacetic acid(34) synthase CmoB [Halothiobacillaceae bacterium]